jgi:hypothetical protein
VPVLNLVPVQKWSFSLEKATVFELHLVYLGKINVAGPTSHNRLMWFWSQSLG